MPNLITIALSQYKISYFYNAFIAKFFTAGKQIYKHPNTIFMKHILLAGAALLLACIASTAQTFSYSNTSCSGVAIILYADNGVGGCGAPVAMSDPFIVPAGTSGTVTFTGTTPSSAAFTWSGGTPPASAPFNFTYAEVYNACLPAPPPPTVNGCGIWDNGVIIKNPNCGSPSTDAFSIPLGQICDYTLDHCSPCPFPNPVTADFTIPTLGDWDINVY